MRTTCLVALLFVAACGHHTPASPTPTSEQRSITVRMVQTDRPDTLPPRRVDPRYAAFQARYDSLVTLVDTMVVLSPDSIVLRVGQSMPVLDSVRVESRRASGESLPGTGHLFAVEDRSIAQTSDARLIGVSVGRTRLVITLIGKKALAHAPPSYVLVIVLP